MERCKVLYCVCMRKFLLFCAVLVVGALPVLPVFAEIDAGVPPEMTDSAELTSYGSRDVIATVVSVTLVPGDGNLKQYDMVAKGDDGVTYNVNTALSFSEGMHYAVTPGDRVILSVVDNQDGTATAYLADAVRTSGVVWALIIFAAVTIAVGLKRGLYALVGFALTLGILMWFVFPQILGGANPVHIAVLAGVGILAVNLYLSHGFTRNATIALGSTTVGVILAWVLGALFVAMSKLSGLSSEESVFLYWQVGGVTLPEGLLLAGIILGTVGVLDDVAVTQCETVAELKAANPTLSGHALFFRAMRVGRHHIASTVNTLVLAYAGSSLPLLLIFRANSDVSFWRFVNTEAVAEEIIRTLAGTTALVLVVPLATALAALVWAKTSTAGRAAYVTHEHGDG